MSKQTLTPVEGVPTQIGFYLAGMEEVREQLRDAVAEITSDQLHAKLRPDTHSIAQLILHCGEAEWWWIQCVVAGREIDEELKSTSFWDVLEEGNEPSSAMSAITVVGEIDRIRSLTRELLSGFQDEDLDRYFERELPTRKIDKSLRWILHHLIDHEAQHKGQILMLKRLLSGESRES
ncbi:MAG: DinB family protein [Acidobacteriota bacterium]|nr:DinB family protein [Acidobacteriota bacterium]MDH3529772.1 DinB family protein [Acidobacteriota bacterium]